jgi:hypothetical protein
MLFGYPVAATQENWLHDCLVDMITTIHTRLDKGLGVLKWPELIPSAHRSVLKSRVGLKKHLDAYRLAVKKLDANDRSQIRRCLSEQNNISELLSCGSECQQLTDLPEAVHKPVEKLLGFAFGLLTDLGIRDRNYKLIYDAAKYHVCPFCGCEYFDAPIGPGGRTRNEDRAISEDYDHYLPKSRYPFAAANLRNLSPMGGRCNKYKLNRDVLRDAAGKRRRAFYPYANREVSISLSKSIPFGGTDPVTPNWRIEFKPDSPECVTWDDLFNLKSRLKRDVLDQSFQQWLQDFAAWFRTEYGNAKITNARIKAALDRYAKNEAIKGLNGRDFLRALVFRMFHRHCVSNDSRLLKFLKDVVTLSVPP